MWQGDGSGVHTDSPTWTGRTIAIARLPLARQLARQFFPGSIEDPAPDRTNALQRLCRGQADAAFMEVRLLEAMLLRRPHGCETVDFRVQAIDERSTKMAIASTPEFRYETKRLRAQIELMFQDGRFAKFVGRWFVFSNIEARSLADLQQQRRKNIYTLVALGIVLIFLALLFLMYRHARSARQTAERTNLRHPAPDTACFKADRRTAWAYFRFLVSTSRPLYTRTGEIRVLHRMIGPTFRTIETPPPVRGEQMAHEVR
ncbi:MAG: hypothetical protein P4L56_04455 [Candidatus Sulfopaludibacter sp.]|nr:hypothetical protein [Candidatus Sulfopaludibacter sp.]